MSLGVSSHEIVQVDTRSINLEFVTRWFAVPTGSAVPTEGGRPRRTQPEIERLRGVLPDTYASPVHEACNFPDRDWTFEDLGPRPGRTL